MRLQALPLAVAGALLSGSAQAAPGAKAKNFIYVVPDGYGVASQVLARDYYSITNGEGTVARPDTSALGVDTMIVGSVKTQASDNLVTDSAASGTAYACGHKTYNGAISVDDDGLPVASVLEAAYLKGLKTGLVVTSRMSHATPAVYSAHVLYRDSENEIAAQQVGYSHPWGKFVNILIGGGRRHYLPTSQGGRREDGVNLVNWAVENGYNYAADKSEFEEAQEDGILPLPFLGLFTSSDLTYEVDRDVEREPSLLETTIAAIHTLADATKRSCKGYFIMVEASRIDHAAHANDATAHLHETLMYNEVMLWLKNYVEENPDTQLLSAADHECGGLTLIDGYDPLALARGQNSGDYIRALATNYAGDDLSGFLSDTILPAVGVVDYTEEDLSGWVSIANSEGASAAVNAIYDAFHAVAGINWSTGGHSAADVVLYGHAQGPRQAELERYIGGFRDNTELPGYVARVLDLDLDAATSKLRANGTNWVQKRELLADIKKRANEAAREHSHEY
ncbi:putative alkaline phosphatase [Stachybotrys elegans]|uniref:Alkaline phosphatase n=1 Tax=Stachybotrys elegans TaxID=80388 RepID=A0A8K0WP52_9HYPO|nr:putative alkaline phosphatase [Stachybotrys elegans]